MNGTPTELHSQMLVTGVDSCNVVIADVRATADTLIAPQRVISVSASTCTYLLPVATYTGAQSNGGVCPCRFRPISFFFFTLSRGFWEKSSLQISILTFGRAAALLRGENSALLVPCAAWCHALFSCGRTHSPSRIRIRFLIHQRLRLPQRVSQAERSVRRPPDRPDGC